LSVTIRRGRKIPTYRFSSWKTIISDFFWIFWVKETEQFIIVDYAELNGQSTEYSSPTKKT